MLIMFGLIINLTACDSGIINNNQDDKGDETSTQPRSDYDDMTNLVRYSPFSKNNNNFLVINPETYPKASSFMVEVKASEEMEDGSYEFVTAWKGRMTPKTPYVHIPTEFNTKNKAKYALIITVLDGAGNAMAQGPIPTAVEPLAVMEPSPDFYLYSMVTCNGPDYAYNLGSFTDDETNPIKYKIEMLSQRYSPDPNETGELEVQFYQYMSETQFIAWEQQNPPVGHYGGNPSGEPVYQVDVLFPGELPPGNYYNSQNTILQEPIYAVEKDFGPWKGDANQGEDALSAPYYPQSDFSNWYGFSGNFSLDNDQDLIYFSSRINNDIIPEDSRYGTDVICKQVALNGDYGSSTPSGVSSTASEASIIFQDCLGNIISSGDGTADPNSDNVIQITNCGDEDEGDGIGDGYDVYSVSFKKIDAYKRTKPFTLYPKRFKKEGYSYSLEQGLYDVKVITENKTVLRFLKKVNGDEEYSYDPARGGRAG